MTCISTRGRAPAVLFRDAVRAGLAPDGGLYVPREWPVLDEETVHALAGKPLPDVAVGLLAPLVGADLPRSDLASILAGALDFPVPLVRLDDRLAVLELFHGPTFAFKDIGARVLARLLAYFSDRAGPSITVLVATSGDTGGAVAHAFHRVERTRVVVLYPRGQVSAVQEAQFTTLGDNVTAVAVEGTFDDCQRLAKAAFAEPLLRQRANLTSANSISLGRLLPQMTYYLQAALDPWLTGPATVSVPSGNFGNIAAGLMAARLGAPIAHFHAATTVNDTVPRFLATGALEPRPSVPTLANAMDVGDPSNLERIRWMFQDDAGRIRASMSTSVQTDEDVREAVKALDRRYGYLADPHTAIGYLGARRQLDGGADQVIFLSTAHPAKFADVVEPIVGRSIGMPAALAAALERPRQVVEIAPQLDALAELL